MSEWREWLYPLGFIANLAFTARFLLQWMKSEVSKKSVVTKQFWNLSLLGNSTLVLHGLIQSQIHVCLIQALNGVISWRNLNLMQPKEKRINLKTTLLLMGIIPLFVLLLFTFQTDLEWFRVPKTPWLQQDAFISSFWHVLGSFGLVLFSSRFWLQWWTSEKQEKSELGLPFWWMSLIGGLLCAIYFLLLGDLVNLVGPAFGLIPYFRNLRLIYATR